MEKSMTNDKIGTSEPIEGDVAHDKKLRVNFTMWL